jgi:hypothetical protein
VDPGRDGIQRLAKRGPALGRPSVRRASVSVAGLAVYPGCAHHRFVASEQRKTLARWTQRLTGLPPDWVLPALERVESWKLNHVSAELLADSVDAAASATLLCTSMDELAARGIPAQRWIKKLRHDQTVWSAWAEVRVAAILARSQYAEAQVRLEEGRSQGAHPDLRFLVSAEKADSVEIKTIGLSDQEVAFCERMAPALRRMLPRAGVGHVHAPIDGQPPKQIGALRRAGRRTAGQAARVVPEYPRGLRVAVIVGHGSEDAYNRRVASRVTAAVRQLPQGHRCWVAVYWSNGASMAGMQAAIDWSEIPERVVGLLLVGQGVAFPHPQIHAFSTAIPRDDVGEFAGLVVASEAPDQEDLAATILHRFERSAGVRATLIRVGARDLIVRDGSRRILPFNLLMDADVEEFARSDALNVEPFGDRSDRPI